MCSVWVFGCIRSRVAEFLVASHQAHFIVLDLAQWFYHAFALWLNCGHGNSAITRAMFLTMNGRLCACTCDKTRPSGRSLVQTSSVTRLMVCRLGRLFTRSGPAGAMRVWVHRTRFKRIAAGFAGPGCYAHSGRLRHVHFVWPLDEPLYPEVHKKLREQSRANWCAAVGLFLREWAGVP